MSVAVLPASLSGSRPLAWAARRPLATLFLLCLVVWLPGFFTLPAMDRDESRFAQASKQMVETGNLVDIRFGTETRYKKPIGIHWLQAAATFAFGHPPFNQIWTYRLPSLLGALAAVFLAYWSMRALAPSFTALAGAALLALTLGLTAEAHLAKTDAVLLASVVGVQAVLLRVYLAAREAAQTKPGIALILAGWVALAVGILVKGPVVVAVVGLTALAVSLWDREWRWLGATRPLLGTAVTLALVLPWFIAIAIQSHGAFFQQAVGHDFAAKLVGGQESHGAPPGYYILLSTLTLWPATLFALPAIGSAIADRKTAATRFLLAWAGASWLMFELVPTKLPHYTLPTYPALAMLMGLWLARAPDASEPRWQKVLRYVACGQFVLGVAILSGAAILGPEFYGAGTPRWIAALVAAAAAAGFAAALMQRRGANGAALIAAAVCALIFYSTIFCGVAPRLDRIWLSRSAAALVAKDGKTGDPALITAGYAEPSLVFLLGTQTRIETGRTAADQAGGQGGLVLVDEAQRRAFLNRLMQLGVRAKPVDALSGFNYSHGKSAHLTLYRVWPRHGAAPPPE